MNLDTSSGGQTVGVRFMIPAADTDSRFGLWFPGVE